MQKEIIASTFRGEAQGIFNAMRLNEPLVESRVLFAFELAHRRYVFY